MRANKLNRKIFIFALLLVGAGFLFFGSDQVLAQAGGDFGVNEFAEETALASTDIRVIIARIIRAVLGLLGIIATVIIMYGGYIYMTSGGNEEKIEQAKKILINAVIGLAIIMSAFTIVVFVLRALTGQGSGGGPGPGAPPPPVFNTFAGSGALGGIVRDHYPFRDETNVYRNTWITVTFREPIDPSTIIENTNGTCWKDGGGIGVGESVCNGRPAYYGDCVTPLATETFDWQTHCDQLKTDAVSIYRTDEAGLSPRPLVEAAAMTAYQDGAENNAYTFTFRPLELLGSPTDEVWYTTRLNKTIEKSDGTEAFPTEDYYWEFETNTMVDLDPPTVESVSPSAGESVARNKIVRITFSEKMNPISIVGTTNLIFDRAVAGQWEPSNNYKTYEFIPSTPCGTNSCGDTLYCLNIDCPANEPECTDDYQTLARTATLNTPATSWVARPPLDGIVDNAGNALDGNDDNIRQDAPPRSSNLASIGLGETIPDNYYWDFEVENRIELTPAYIHKITPKVDQSWVTGLSDLSITFGSPMTYVTLYDIRLREYPENALIPGSNNLHLTSIWQALSMNDGITPIGSATVTTTKVTINHREFGPNGMDLYYFTSVPSTVLNDYQNCMYPGRGPDEVSREFCTLAEDALGVETSSGCIPSAPFNFTGNYQSTDTGCPNLNSVNLQTDTLGACLTNLEALSTF